MPVFDLWRVVMSFKIVNSEMIINYIQTVLSKVLKVPYHYINPALSRFAFVVQIGVFRG